MPPPIRLREIERGRGDLVLARIQASWTSWRSRAIEPVVRESLRRLPGDILPDRTNVIGGYWTRTNNPEIDIVGADRDPIAKQITLVGSVKWLEQQPFNSHDLTRLNHHRSQLPRRHRLDPAARRQPRQDHRPGVLTLEPDDLITAWQSG